MTATTTNPYIPKQTDNTLPRGVIATKSPKPIVVTIAKQYHKASGNVVMFGSILIKIREKQTINVNKPKRISNEKVFKMTLSKTFTFNCEKAILAASINDTTAIKIHSTKQLHTTTHQ